MSRDPSELVRVPSAGTRPTWFEEPLPSEPPCWACELETVTVGEAAALVRSAAGELFVHDARHGAMGPIAQPGDATWFGLGEGDRGFAAGPGGQLWLVQHIADAREANAWRHAARVPGAKHWDVSSRYVVASDGERVHVSQDHGGTFAASSRVGSIERVFVRHDGVIAAVVKTSKGPKIRLSHDGGRSFTNTDIVLPELAREGGWLGNLREPRWECLAVLADDGRTWVRPNKDEVHAFRNLRGWAGPLGHAEKVSAVADSVARETQTTPATPAVAGHRRVRGRLCRPLAKWGGSGFGTGRFNTGRHELVGVAKLRLTAAPTSSVTRHHVALAKDGTCAARDADEHGFCRAPFELTRLPHLAHIDETSGRMRFENLPAACDRPERAFSATGLGVLLCREGRGARVFAVEPGGAVKEEAKLPAAADVWNYSSGPDGTLMLQTRCPPDRACQVLVRAPVPAGTASAWRVVAVPGAVTYRAATGGSVLAAVQPDPNESDRLQLVLAGPDGDEKLADLRFAPDDLEITSDGRIALLRREGDATRRFYVRHSGELVEGDLIAPNRDEDGRWIVEQTRSDPALWER